MEVSCYCHTSTTLQDNDRPPRVPPTSSPIPHRDAHETSPKASALHPSACLRQFTLAATPRPAVTRSHPRTPATHGKKSQNPSSSSPSLSISQPLSSRSLRSAARAAVYISASSISGSCFVIRAGGIGVSLKLKVGSGAVSGAGGRVCRR